MLNFSPSPQHPTARHRIYRRAAQKVSRRTRATNLPSLFVFAPKTAKNADREKPADLATASQSETAAEIETTPTQVFTPKGSINYPWRAYARVEANAGRVSLRRFDGTEEASHSNRGHVLSEVPAVRPDKGAARRSCSPRPVLGLRQSPQQTPGTPSPPPLSTAFCACS